MTSYLAELQNLSVKTQVLSLAGLLVIAAIALRSIICWYRLRHVPGPFINAWTSWIQAWKIARGQLTHYSDGLAKRYGPLVRVGPNHVMYSDPETCRELSGVRSAFSRGPYYEGTRFVPGKDHVGSLIDDKKHATLKKLLAPGYSGLENGGFEASVDRSIARFIDMVEKKYISTKSEIRPFEFAYRAMFFTLDALSDATYSEPFGFVEKDQDLYGFIHRVEAGMPIFASAIVVPGLHKWVHAWPINLLMPRIGDKNGLGGIMTFINRVLEERLQPNAPPKRDVLQSWIKARLPRDQLLQEICLQIVAGSDTTATAIRMAILFLLTSPPSLRRFLAEIDRGIAAGNISSPITNAEALALPYLQAVIREALRLYPPVLLAYREVPMGGETIHGYRLPAGTQVGQNIWGMQRSRTIFGEDADVFRPERWIEVDKSRYLIMSETVSLVFGHGKFGCLGKPLALMELNKIFVELFKRFEFSILDPVRPINVKNATLWLLSDFWLKQPQVLYRRRKSGPNINIAIGTVDPLYSFEQGWENSGAEVSKGGFGQALANGSGGHEWVQNEIPGVTDELELMGAGPRGRGECIEAG